MCCCWESLRGLGSLSENSRSCLPIRGTFGLIASGQPCSCVGRDRGQGSPPWEPNLWSGLSFPGPVTSLRSSVLHFLLGCWPQRGSCLERAGDIWGDDMKKAPSLICWLIWVSALCWELWRARNAEAQEAGLCLRERSCEITSTQTVLPTRPETDNKCYFFQLNASPWGLIWGCNFYISWKFFPLLSVTVKVVRTPSL